MAEIIKKAYFTKGRRYYILLLKQDLSGEWVIIKRHGVKKTDQINMVSEKFSSYEKALAHYNAMRLFRITACHYQCISEN